ncbi:MAG: RnfABCDGE type electron transport complex subunit A [Oscillospiraceae bacterium]|nr:RnfABCDGE type electron transport complex subunit A [Oscillospiraceae bacterium]MBR6209472.1 RnfABCDGE type electron transport complex subunit A [Oscillospiraceae bacterium]
MSKLLYIAFIMIFTQNYVMVQFLGICPFLGVSKKLDSAVGMTGAVVFVMTLASAVTWLIFHYVMEPLNLDYLSTIIFILVIAALVQFVEIFLKKYAKGLYQALGIYLPLITTNCIVLAATLLNIDEEYTFIQSIVNGLAAGVGFGLALVLFCGVRQALENAKPPKSFEGLPITMVAAALTSLTFMGFTGMAENLFH